jgi:CBS domain-containing protein
MATVGKICNRQVVTVPRDVPVLEAARCMRDRHVGSVVVVEDERPIGILTDRDIVVGVLATAAPYLDRLLVGDVMSEPPMTARVGEDAAALLGRMRREGVRRAPVVGDDGRLEGIVAFDDFVEYLSEELRDLASLLARERQREREHRN